MSRAHRELHDLPLEPRLDDYLQANDLPGKLVESAREALSDVVERARPASWYMTDTIVDVAARSMTLEHSGRFGVGWIARALEDRERVVLFVCTLGPGIDARQRELAQEGDPLALWLFDEMGSFCVERVGDAMQEAAAQDYPGLRASHRFGPGYCGWDVSEQARLFEAFHGTDVAVDLTAGSCMTPRKSISGFFVLTARSGPDTNPCRFHDDEDCPWRRPPW
jgi:hypothetical protein